MSKKLVLTIVSVMSLAVFACSATAAPLPVAPVANAQAAPAAENEVVVLPSRLANAISRAEASLAKAAEHIDEAEYAKAIISLRAVRKNLLRADKAARHQMTAVPADPEAETTPGPDSVVAALSLDQEVAMFVADLFDGQTGTLVSALGTTVATAQTTRDKLLDAVLALDPETDGAAYADGMADTLDGYDDEVANIGEALADDALSAGGKSALNAALGRSKATQVKIQAAFGGGE